MSNLAVTVTALAAEFVAAYRAASDAPDFSEAEIEAGGAQASVNRIAYRLGVVFEVEKAISQQLGYAGVYLSNDAEEIGL